MDTLSLLKDLSAGVSRCISYQIREDEGTQSPTQALDRGWGSRRDFAVLLVEVSASGRELFRAISIART